MVKWLALQRERKGVRSTGGGADTTGTVKLRGDKRTKAFILGAAQSEGVRDGVTHSFIQLLQKKCRDTAGKRWQRETDSAMLLASANITLTAHRDVWTSMLTQAR